MCESKKYGNKPNCFKGCNSCGKNYNTIKREQVVEIFSKEFDLMCFVKDSKVMCGICKLEEISKKFGEGFVNHCLYDKKILFVDKKNGGIDWSDYGKQYMAI
jgi:hypothetical protein